MDVISYALSKKYTDEKCKDMEDKRQQDNLKVTKVEKELNDYKRTLQQVNVNHEAKQTASGYGTISLPKNAANGQISVSVKGLTATNLIKNGDFRNGTENWYSTGIDNFNVTNNTAQIIARYRYGYIGQDIKNCKIGDKIYVSAFIKADSNSTIRLNVNYKEGIALISKIYNGNGEYEKLYGIKELPSDLGDGFPKLLIQDYSDNNWTTIYIKDVLVINLTQLGLEDKTADEINEMFPYYFEGTKSTISAMRITAENEDKTEKSQAYVIAKDKDNKIVNLNSLPNGIKDEIRVSGGKAELIKRVNEKTLNGSENWTAMSSLTNVYRASLANNFGITDKTGNNAKMIIGNIEYPYIFNYTEDTEHWYWDGSGVLFISKSKIDSMVGSTLMEKWKNYLSQNPATLIYQLAEPIITPIQVSGNLITYPSGTIYIEPVVADAGIYGANGIGVLHQELPINYIEKISKIDFETGLETELDTSQAIISEDGTYFTHPELVEGDIVFFEYYYPSDMTTQGETEVEYYDSRYVIKDSVTGKFYKWKIAVADGTPTIELEEV